MGYLSNSGVVLVDAVLTKLGRAILASGEQNFKITKFAFADDEIDYGLYDPNNSLGTNNYGSAITTMPILEAFIDDTSDLKYKLITLNKGVAYLPIIAINPSGTSFTLPYGTPSTFTISTTNGGNSTLGYSVNLSNTSVGILSSNNLLSSDSTTSNLYLGDSSLGSVIGQTIGVKNSFTFTPKQLLSAAGAATIIITGLETGGSISITITVPVYNVSIQNVPFNNNFSF